MFFRTLGFFQGVLPHGGRDQIDRTLVSLILTLISEAQL